MRMKNQGDSSSEEIQLIDVGVDERLVVCSHFLDRSTRKFAVHDAGIDSSLFKDVAILQNAGDATSSMRPVPLISAELFSVYVLQGKDDAILVLLNQRLHAQPHGRSSCDLGSPFCDFIDFCEGSALDWGAVMEGVSCVLDCEKNCSYHSDRP